MANTKQQKKRIGTNEKRRQANVIIKSSIKRAIKKVEESVQANDKEKALSALNYANTKLDKSLVKGVYHKNYVARHKSSLAKLVNSIE